MTRRSLLGFVSLLIMLSGFLGACGERVPAPPARTVILFANTTVHFTPEAADRYDTPLATARDNGRVMTTYHEFPEAPRGRRVALRLALRPIRQDIRNVVDRWDRAGWVRLIKPGQAPVEMVRFMTAYGGATEHEVDITHLAPLLSGHCQIEIFIDTWVSPAWQVDVELVFTPCPAGGLDVPHWAAGALFPEEGLTADQPDSAVEIQIPAGIRRVLVAAVSTGHCTDGRDADEFITKDNVLLVDGIEAFRWRPWRDDCARFRALNPYCAKWSDGSWSSDYARSGWCPGDVSPPLMIDLSAWLTPGPHRLTWRVEDIRPADPADPEGHHGYWRISAMLAGWR
jgi:hypothetical protein